MLTELWENPIFVRARQVEKRRLGTGTHSFLMRYGGGLLLVLGPLAITMFFTAGELLQTPRAWIEHWLGGVVGFTAFLGILYVTVRAAGAAAGAISLEKEQKTYECLLATRLRSDEVLSGKLSAALWPVARELMAASLLAFAMGLISGHALQSVLLLGLAFSCVTLFGLLGLWASYTASSSQEASRLSTFLAVAFLLLGPLLDFLFYGLCVGGNAFVPLATLTSPMVAAFSVLTLSEAGTMAAWQWTWAGTLVLYWVLSAMLWLSIRHKAERARIA